MTSSAVQLAGVGKAFGGHRVIDNVSLDVAPGELVVFVGPSGCGKSTLLRLIAGLESPDEGRLFIGGRDVTDVHPSERGIAMVFQSYALYPHMTVAENMGFGLKIRGLPKAEIAAKVASAAAILQLDKLLDRKPKALSGGQRQRVAIGRAIVREPQVFLFDEPLSNLDAALRGQMRIELARLHAKLGATMVYVTHDQVEAMTLASKIVVLNRGKVEQVGAPLELYRRPANRFVAGFIGAPSMNFIDGELRERTGDTVRVTLPYGSLSLPRASGLAAEPGPVSIGIRPEDLMLCGETAPNLVACGEVSLVERLGSEALAYVRIGGSDTDNLIVTLAGDAQIAMGAPVWLAANPDAVHLFDRDGTAIGSPP